MIFCMMCSSYHNCAVCPRCGGVGLPQQATPTGWECPRCRKINAPTQAQCTCPAPIAPRGPYPIDVLAKLVAWYDREGKKELDATYSLAWFHGYRTIHKVGDTMLSDIIDEARSMLPPTGDEK